MATSAPAPATPSGSGGSAVGKCRMSLVAAIAPLPLTTTLTKVPSVRSPPLITVIEAEAAAPTMQAFDDGNEADESASRGNFDEEMGSGDCFDDVVSTGGGEKPKLAMFRQDMCGACRERPFEYNCKQCQFGLCEDCFFSGNTGGHNELHEMEALGDHDHCGGSRSNTGIVSGNVCDYSVTQLALSHFLYEPCKGCCRMIVDEETVYKCSTCIADQAAPYVVCEDCFSLKQYTHDEQHIMIEFSWTLGDVKERPVVSKGRNDDGNKVINDYTVVKELGRGSFAKVKLLQNVETKEIFAVKILKKSRKLNATAILASPNKNMGSSTTAIAIPDSVLREIVVMRVLHHPNIVKLVEIIDDLESDKYYVIMEFCENGPLHTLGHPPLSLDALRTMGQHVLRGLRYLHSNGLYHRDIKPANCLVDSNGVAKLADFGACDMKHISSYTDGTPAFMCPELMRGEEVDGVVADSWAFAVTMYQAAYGVLPFPTLKYNAIQLLLAGDEEIPFPPSPEVPSADDGSVSSRHAATDAQQLESLLRAMLVKDIAHRCKIDDAVRHPFFGSMDVITGSSVRKGRDHSLRPHISSNSVSDRTRSVDISRDSSSDRQLLSGIPVITVDDNPPRHPSHPPHPHNVSMNGTAPFHPSFADTEDAFGTSGISFDERAELYARAMSLVKKGSRVHQSFYGLHRVKEARKQSLAVIERRNAEGDESETDQVGLWSPMRNPSSAADPASPMEGTQVSLSDSAGASEPREQPRTPLVSSLVDDNFATVTVAAPADDSDPLNRNNNSIGRRRSTVTTITATHSSNMDTRTRREQAKIEKVMHRLLNTSNNTQAHIKGVSLGNNIPDQLSEVLHLNIKSLAITECKLSALRGLRIPAFSNLRDLNLSKNNFHEFPVEVLLGCPKLQLLDVSFNRIKTIPDQLCEAPFLERLSLHYNQISSFTAASLTGKHFHHLRLSDNPVTQLPVDNTSAFTNVKVVVDDAPTLVQQWAAMIASQSSGGLSIIWNDVYPKQMLPGYPWFVAANPLALYSVHQLRQLDIKHIIVPDVIRKYRRQSHFGFNESDDSTSTRSTSGSSVSSGRRRASKRPKCVAVGNSSGLPLKIPVLHPSAEKLFSGIHYVDTDGFIGPNSQPLAQFLEERYQQGGGSVMLCMDDSLPSHLGSTEAERTEISHHQRVIVASILDAAARVTSYSPEDIREALSEARLGVYN
jgi:serine/threonine protein kinase/Leucine-rich repeat (LRR) protein